MTTRDAPAGLDTHAEVQKTEEAGASREQSVAKLYAAIRASEAHIAEMRNDISSRFDALDTNLSGKLDALGTKLDALGGKLDAEVDALDTNLSGRIEALGW